MLMEKDPRKDNKPTIMIQTNRTGYFDMIVRSIKVSMIEEMANLSISNKVKSKLKGKRGEGN